MKGESKVIIAFPLIDTSLMACLPLILLLSSL